jgi:hypothetical protein
MKLKAIKMKTVMSFALALVFAALATAQQPTKPGREKQSAKQSMSMGEMMKECRRHHQEMQKSIDQTTKVIDEAEQSNDPARRQAAIAQARNSLAEMKNRMDRCMNMMDTMEKMHGKRQMKQ